VVDFGTNRKRVCDFLLVINSNLGPCPVTKILQFSGEKSDPTLFHPNFGGVPLGLIVDVVAPRSEDPKLIIRYFLVSRCQKYRDTFVDTTRGKTF